MKQKKITRKEKQCISECIVRFWSEPAQNEEDRDEHYEQCLTGCDVCGSSN